MSKTLAIWLPTYRRPHRLTEVLDNIRTKTINSYTVYFGVEPDDDASIEMVRLLIQRGEANGQNVKLIINQYDMGYSNTIQTCYENSDEPFWVHANDDFTFLDRWDEHPIAMFETESVKVVGVPQNDADKTYSAICFGRRSYIDEESGVIDMPKRVFYPYHHNYQDTEFTRTAQARGVWAASTDRCIDHAHPGFTGAPLDDTYKKNIATAGDDERTFDSRKHLWENL